MWKPWAGRLCRTVRVGRHLPFHLSPCPLKSEPPSAYCRNLREAEFLLHYTPASGEAPASEQDARPCPTPSPSAGPGPALRLMERKADVHPGRWRRRGETPTPPGLRWKEAHPLPVRPALSQGLRGKRRGEGGEPRGQGEKMKGAGRAGGNEENFTARLFSCRLHYQMLPLGLRWEIKGESALYCCQAAR